MFRQTVVCLVLLTTSAAGAPVPREELRPPIPLGGTVWEGDGVVAPTVYEFHPDGQMTLSYSDHRYPNTGTWKQDGRAIYWETCGQYCEFQGTQTGNSISGRSWNKPGGEWTLTVKRKCNPAAQ